MEYELILADRRSIRLQLRDDGSLLVRAPRWMSRREVDAFVASKEQWICEKRAILARGNRDWGGVALSPEELAQLRKAAQADLGARLEKWAARLGVHPTKLTIRTQHARWEAVPAAARSVSMRCSCWRRRRCAIMSSCTSSVI